MVYRLSFCALSAETAVSSDMSASRRRESVSCAWSSPDVTPGGVPIEGSSSPRPYTLTVVSRSPALRRKTVSVASATMLLAQLDVGGEQVRLLDRGEHLLDALLVERSYDERRQRGAGKLEGLRAVHDDPPVAEHDEARNSRREHLDHGEAADVLDHENRLPPPPPPPRARRRSPPRRAR